MPYTPPVVSTRACHVVFEGWGCDPVLLKSPEVMLKALRTGAAIAKTEVLGELVHDFDGDGVTALLLLSTSHASCHTWPGEGYVSFDFYTCGEGDPREVVKPVLALVKAKKFNLVEIIRGNPNATHVHELKD